MKLNRRTIMKWIAALGLSSVGISAPHVQAASRNQTGARIITPPSSRTMMSKAVRASAAQGGHLYKHVGSSSAYLAARTQSKDMRLSFAAASKSGRQGRRAIEQLARFRARPSYISSFRNGPTVDRVYEQAMRRDRSRIASWARTAKPGTDLKVGFVSPTPVGSVYTARSGSGGGRTSPANRGEFILRKGGSGGFYPHTAKLFAERAQPVRAFEPVRGAATSQISRSAASRATQPNAK